MIKTKEKTEKRLSVKAYIALAVFLETAVNAAFSVLFDSFLKIFYSDYAHLTIWGDIVAIAAVIISFIIYDSFAHVAYHKRRDRIMFLGVVYVASKAASIVHYSAGILANIINADAMLLTSVTVVLAVFEVAVDVIAAVWLIGYFEKKFKEDEK